MIVPLFMGCHSFMMDSNQDNFRNDQIIVGKCMTMCPEREIALREEENLLHFLEFGKKDGKLYRADRNKVIKEYSRPAAGKGDPIASELRPGPILLKTATHLIKNVLSLEAFPWHSVYEFVFDRLRAVRQDMTIQQLSDSYAVRILEHATRIMIYANYRLSEEPANHFDAKINGNHIQECLKKLLNLYDSSSTCRCNRAEFVALYLLFNICSSEAVKYGLGLKHMLKDDPVFDMAMNICLAWWKTNYIRVLRLSHMLPVLHMCALHNQRQEIIRKTLAVMCLSYSSKVLSVPVKHIQTVLDLNNPTQTESLCTLCGLEVLPGQKVRFNKAKFKADFKVPASRQKRIDEDLTWEDTSMLLLGGECNCISTAVT